ncbi:putative ubiquitin-protein ligase [Diaporthe ampelina]|uniref:HECT-type E3 ubiquitin transferase n=1 Tax=Diaporthe ampelina TaxID=1214573 RepID=A0A0G2G0V7_9PEZI|nr:putative ubiquitin-protein ligase [Diaporthe ampelina]
MTGTDENEKASAAPPAHEDNFDEDSEEHDDEDHRYDEHDDDDVFGGFGGPPGGLHSSLALLTGMMSGMGSRLRELLANLRQKDDPSLHLIALNELSELLLVSNEDNLQGHFSADSFVRELVALMKPDDFMEANPEIMLLACRCLANLMEALPSSVTNVVYAGAVPVLCEKLRDIQFIDLAEQALSTLEKISVEYPSAIVKEGGLAACLEYLDFFAMSTQRTAVTTAANCCRNLPHDYFDVVKDAMKILRDVLKNSDQRVVEQASICVSRIVDTWRHNPSKLEALVTEDLLSSILRLLLPGSTNLISPNIHTQFLRVLASTARASPRLSVELMKMNVVETLYQVLTGVSPPNGTDDIASKLDSVLIMQALIHRPREQILEALNVICELLPKLPTGAADPTKGGFNEVTPPEVNTGSSSTSRRRTSDEKRIQLLEGCKAEVRRFALILFPTLTDAFSTDEHDEDDEDDEPSHHSSEDEHDEENEDEEDEEHENEGRPRLLRSKIHKDAKQFLETHETEKNAKSMKKRATKILTDLTELSNEIEAFYLRPTSSGSIAGENGKKLFEKLATYFDSDLFESATSAELLASGIVRVLEQVFSNPDEDLAMAAQAAFIEVFMGYTVKSKPKTATADSPATPFSMMVHKLQDLLSRSEHFEVLTVSSASHGDSHRSSPASMLAKQIRLKLTADDDSDIPKVYRNIMVSIHAIATFKSLEDYLRPRISLSDRPRPARGNRDSLTRALAAMTGGAFPFGAGSPSGRAPPADEDDLEDALECADEKHITEDEETPDRSALDAIVGDLDEDMGDAPTPDPSAVNLEVAAGGKITARKEDGTRVPTPSQGSSSSNNNLAQRSSLLANALLNSPSPSSPSRSMSYAAAIQSVPQDWHLEFSHQGKVLTNDTTVYRAIQKPAIDSNDYSSRNVWILTHEIKIRRVPGPPSAERLSFGSASNEESENGEGNSPASLAKHPSTASILRLLKILHNLNANIDDVLVENKATLKLNIEPLSQFVNTKLTSKLNRQLEEPLIVASNCLPSWSEDLARLYPFLFPFETRHLFLQSTSFGYARSMNRWQNAQSQEELRRNRDDRPFLGRLQRQKVRISRAKILESALKVMDLYGSSQSILEVEYFEEVGTGLGPTLEFYSTVSKEFAMKKLRLWRDADQNESDEYVSGPTGLFPRPLGEDDVSTPNGERILQLFRTLGKFTARSMIDSRIIDINFNPIFFRIGDETSGIKPSLGAMKLVDPVLARSLVLVKKFALAKKTIVEDPNRDATQKVNDIQNITVDNGVRVEDLSLDFTLPGYPEIDLVSNGSQIMLTIDNVDNYLDRVIDMTLGSGVRRQVDAFRTGFSQVFPYNALRAFTPDELCTLFGRTDEDWTLATLMDSIKADHGFNMDSKSVRNLLQTMSEMTPVQRREFLQFTTGSPKLPIGGFKSLTPMFTVVCKPAEAPYTSDDYLPSVMTCANYLKLPDYTDVKILQKRLFTATKEGQGAFHLS